MAGSAEGGSILGEPVVEGEGRAAEGVLDLVGDGGEASFADGAPECHMSCDFFGRRAGGGEALRGFVVGDGLIDERLADGSRDLRGDFGEAERFGTGDGQGLSDVVAGGECFGCDGGDVVGVDEGAAAVAGGGADDAFGLDGVRPGEQVRHESCGADEGEGDAAGVDGGLALLMPCADGEALLDVQ